MTGPAARLLNGQGGRAGRIARRRRSERLLALEHPPTGIPLDAALAGVRGRSGVALEQRFRVLLDTLGQPSADRTLIGLGRATEQALLSAGPAEIWLSLAVLRGQLPVDEDVVETLRRLRLYGPGPALSPVVQRMTSWLARERYQPPVVEVIRGAVTVDVHHTSKTDLATGIQRVARETVRRWNRDHDVVLLGWTADDTALCRLEGAARRRALGTHTPADAHEPTGKTAAPTIVVPWAGSHETLELATELPRTRRMLALARHSSNQTGIIGFDCVPLTTAETTADGMGGAFASTLAAVRHMDRVATISEAAAVEYRGWRSMLIGAGLPGPVIEAVSLPAAASVPAAQTMEEARFRFTVGGLPLVLVVGSHEPRKNHLAVLHAAELLWRSGREFSVLFVGGNAWNSNAFVVARHALRDAGRAIDAVSALDDEMLWATYHLASVVLFPSLNEGFGLPVAEALACGTPTITSGYGSMAEVAQGGGALLVDPRDDADVAAALDRVLFEPGLGDELRRQALARPVRTWDQYAAELWASLVEAGATDDHS